MDRFLVLICTAIAATPATILLLVTILIGVGSDKAIEIMQLVINGVIAIGTIATAIVALYALDKWKDQLNLQNIRTVINEQFIMAVYKTIAEYWDFRNTYSDKTFVNATVIMEGTINAIMKNEIEYPVDEVTKLSNIKYSNKMKINNLPKEIVEKVQNYENTIRKEIWAHEELQQEINELVDYIAEKPEGDIKDRKNNIKKIMNEIIKLREITKNIHQLPHELIEAKE